jgi:hypothetical protein
MPTAEETKIEMHFKDGQPPLTIDAVDVDRVIHRVQESDIPEDSSFERVFAGIFRRIYNRNLSPANVLLLCQIKADLIEKVKKNLYMREEQSDTSEQDTSSQNETSSSSNP